ncbi:MAG: DoxX family protein [Euryarchaeota archaeon]|nr:DoxX family protein [Euryarchaeota archaeon]
MAPETKTQEENALVPAFESLTRHVHWGLRAGLAGIFLFHGLGKFATAPTMAAEMGMPVAAIYMLGALEAGGALLLLAGGFGKELLTRIGALLFIPVMLGAIAMVHWPRWSFTATDSHPMGGMEFQVLVILVSLYLVVKGNAVGGKSV